MENIRKEQIALNLKQIHQGIASACKISGRSVSDISLLLATKTVSAIDIKEASLLGEVLIGENKVQEVNEKDPILSPLSLTRHFIGHLQSNKIKEVLKYVSCIQSIDEISIAEAVNKRLQSNNQVIDIMVQVNTSFESSKFGIHPD